MSATLDALVARLLRDTHELPPLELAPTLERELTALGFDDVAVYLVDHEQRHLVPLPPSDGGAVLGIDSTLAGRVYQRGTIARETGDATRMWFPVRDGIDRLGVMRVSHTEWDDDLIDGCRSVAALVASLLVSKSQYTDDFVQAGRSRPMELGAELCWALLPPLSFSTVAVGVSAALQPAYAVSGDSFDYALNGSSLQVAIFDGMGHDLGAARLAELMVAGYRHCRRRERSLLDTYGVLDELLRSSFGADRFVTAQLATLDTETGQFEMLSAGHPGPLLVRDGHVLEALSPQPALPLGFGDLDRAEPEILARSLQPDDRLLFYTDGLTEARAPDGSLFGEERLVDVVERARNDTHVLAEAVRRLMHSLGEFRDDVWHDDATLVMVHWTPRRDAEE